MTVALECAALLALLSLPPGQEPPDPPRFPFDGPAAKRYRADFARVRGLPASITNSIGIELLLIPPGRFEMGVKGGKYRVTLAKPFYIGAAEVTNAQYRTWRAGHKVDGAGTAFQEGNRPAARVSWREAREFCRWLSERPKEKAAGRTYALPTEAQWEWAARAGSREDYPSGDRKRLTEFAWFNHTYTPNPKHESGGRGRQPVKKLKPNAWGIYDLFGNVWEWCADRREDSATGETRDPVMRGGSWRSGGSHCTTAARDPGAPGFKADNVGFRVVCTTIP